MAIFTASTLVSTGRRSHALSEPRLLQQALGFEGPDLLGMAQRQRDVVIAAKQAELAERLDFEGELATIGTCDRLALEVDGERIAGKRGHIVEQARHIAR